MNKYPLKQRARVLALLLLTLSIAKPSLAQDCDAKLIEALKTNYHIQDTHVLAEALYDLVCNSSSSGLGVGYAGYSVNFSEASKACQQHDHKYFERYSRDLAYSFLPDKAWSVIRDVCNRNPVELSATVEGNVVNVTAKLHPMGNVHQAKVSSFNFTTNSVSCTTKNIHSGMFIKNGPTQDICTRTSDQPITFIINTEQGGQFFTLPEVPQKDYWLLIYPVDDHFECTLNDSLVGSLNFGQPTTTIKLTGFHPGKNILKCTIRDDHPCGDGQACWSYSFQVRYGDDVIGGGSDSGHGRPTVNPPPIIIDYTGPHSLTTKAMLALTAQ
jgi:hypothetical protein